MHAALALHYREAQRLEDSVQVPLLHLLRTRLPLREPSPPAPPAAPPDDVTADAAEALAAATEQLRVDDVA